MVVEGARQIQFSDTREPDYRKIDAATPSSEGPAIFHKIGMRSELRGNMVFDQSRGEFRNAGLQGKIVRTVYSKGIKIIASS